MTDYNNPNDYWQHPDPYEGMDDDDRLKAGCLQMAGIVFAVLLALAVCALLGGCTTTKYVAVPQQHTEHHWHTDSVLQTDSIIDRQTTLIREVDSAAMAQYGIQMSALQTAWLIQTDRLQRELSRLRERKTDTVTVRDSIPYAVEVIREVERKRSAIEGGLMLAGLLLLIAVIVFAATRLRRLLP